ncbi:MAG: CbiX/SirB N-terminal domain-containing protein [bacterium]
MHGLSRAEKEGAGAEAPPRTAVLLLGHGSRAAGANEAMHRVAAHFREEWPDRIVESAFLEINEPSIPGGIDLCAEAGAERIVLIPYFLHLGNHVQEDLPRFVEEGKARHPGVELILGPHLGFHPKLIEIVEERIAEAVGAKISEPA